MNVDASPLATGLLIRAVLDNAPVRREVTDRLEYLGLEPGWLERLSKRYVEFWRFTVPKEEYSRTNPVAEETIKMLSWLLNQLPAADVGVELTAQVFAATQAELAKHVGLDVVPPAERLTVTAGVVGRPVPIIDQNFPVLLPGGLVEPNVELAYEGFVEHVASAGAGDWPEMHRTSLLWRLAGIAEGLQGGGGNLHGTLGDLNKLVGSAMPLSMRRVTGEEWKKKFVAHRNVFTHVSEYNGYTFQGSLGEHQDNVDLGEYLKLATLYMAVHVGAGIAQVPEQEPQRWSATADRDFEWFADHVS